MEKRKVSVKWETDNQKVKLPKIVKIPREVEDEEISDYLSDKYGWLVNSWCRV